MENPHNGSGQNHNEPDELFETALAALTGDLSDTD